MTRRTVVDIATQVAAGSLSAATVLEENLAAITAREHEIHAFNLVTADRARERAAEIDADVKAGKKVGRLAGVTISLKDNMCTRGVETTCSSKILAGWKPPYDATVVRRLADEGEPDPSGQRVDGGRFARVRAAGKGHFTMGVARQVAQVGDGGMEHRLLEQGHKKLSWRMWPAIN